MFHPVGHPMERGWVGRIDGDRVVHLAAQTLQSFFTGGGTAREHAEYPLEETVLLAPVLHPPSIRIFDDAGVVRVRESCGGRRPRRVRLRADVESRRPPATWRRSWAPAARSAGSRCSPSGVLSAIEPPKDRDFALGLGPVVVTPERRDPQLDGFDWPAAVELAAAGTALHPGDILAAPASEPIAGEPAARGQDRDRGDRRARAAHRCVTALVVDWDGTVTAGDTLHAAIAEFGDTDVFVAMESEIGRRLTLQEVIATEMATIDAPLDEVVAFLLENISLRPGFAELVEHHDPLVVSMGFHELIEPLLARDRIEVPVVANRLDVRPDGWRAVFREQAVCAVCGEPCKRSDVAGLDGFVYVGDGFSDRCVAQAASRVFARDGLAEYLAAEGVAFERFDDFHDVARALGE